MAANAMSKKRPFSIREDHKRENIARHLSGSMFEVGSSDEENQPEMQGSCNQRQAATELHSAKTSAKRAFARRSGASLSSPETPAANSRSVRQKVASVAVIELDFADEEQSRSKLQASSKKLPRAAKSLGALARFQASYPSKRTAPQVSAKSSRQQSGSKAVKAPADISSSGDEDDDDEEVDEDEEDEDDDYNSAEADEDHDDDDTKQLASSTARLALIHKSIEEEEKKAVAVRENDDTQWLQELGFVVGVAVELQGLQAAPELNGKTGKLVEFNSETMRWQVDIADGVGLKNFKLANLMVIEDTDKKASDAADEAEDDCHWEDEGGEEEEKEVDECVVPEGDVPDSTKEDQRPFSSEGDTETREATEPEAFD